MELKAAVITAQGRALMAKLLTGTTTARFTKIVTSSRVYNDNQLEALTTVANVKQTIPVQGFEATAAHVYVEGALYNTGLSAGYTLNTIGLYANDPSVGEVLFSVVTASVAAYIPADNGISQTGIVLKFLTEVSNASKVDLKVDLAAVATFGDIQRVRGEIEKSFLANLVYISQVDQRLLQSERLLNDLNGISGNITLNNSRSYPFNNSVVTVPIAKTRNNLQYSVDVDVLTETGGFAGDVIVYDKQLNGFKLKFTGSARSVNVRYKLTGGLYK